MGVVAQPHPRRAARLPRLDQATGHRVAAGHRDPGDAAGAPRDGGPAVDPQHADRRHAGGRGREHAELRRRRRHRARVMTPPARRPLPRAAVPTRHALVFGIVLSVASFFWLWWTTNLLSGLLAVATIAFYVFVYTLLLKRRTSQNVVWGGAAGCMPVMISWSAVTGTIGWPALAMFAIIFFWTPPHTWALAMRYKEDYQAAGVPMLPAVATERQVTKQILIYTWLTVLATLALALATGWLYASVAMLAGAWFLVMAHQLYAGVRRGEPVKPLRVFLQSNNYLAVVFCALAVDSVLALPTLFTV